MSFSLSFSPEFFFAAGEPYDSTEPPPKKPKSVWQAIQRFGDDQEEWASMARELFGLRKGEERLLMAEAVLDKIRETDTCTSLESPVEVWIDPAGDYRIRVW